jgi:hypothetical protein
LEHPNLTFRQCKIDSALLPKFSETAFKSIPPTVEIAAQWMQNVVFVNETFDVLCY